LGRNLSSVPLGAHCLCRPGLSWVSPAESCLPSISIRALPFACSVILISFHSSLRAGQRAGAVLRSLLAYLCHFRPKPTHMSFTRHYCLVSGWDEMVKWIRDQFSILFHNGDNFRAVTSAWPIECPCSRFGALETKYQIIISQNAWWL